MLELDVLRGLCALGVLLFHYTTFYKIYFLPKENPLFYMPWVPYRVQLFAMLSGFVILMIIEKTISPLDFVVARFSRLYPCYFAAVIFISLLMIVFPLPNKEIITWPRFLGNLTMLQAWLGYWGVDRSFWFLTPEISFYFVVTLIFKFKKLNYIEAIGFLGLVFVVFNARYASLGPLEIPAVVLLSRVLSFWHYFFAGILFYNLKSKGEAWYRHAGLALCFIVQNLISDDVYTILSFACCLLIFYLFIYGKLSWIIRKPLLFLGTISYSLFLIHQNMGCIVIFYLLKIGANAWLLLIIPTIVAIVVATLMTYLIEKPAMKYIRDKYKARAC